MNWKNSSLASAINTIHKSIRFHDFFKSHFAFVMRLHTKRVRRKQQKRVEQIRKNDKIKVAFLFQTPAVWKYDRVYRIMVEDSIFDPVVVIVPYNVNLFYDMNETMSVMDQSERYAKKMGYNYVVAFDKKRKRWGDIRKSINPDVVFFAKPYKDTFFKYHLYNFEDRLTCYSPYGFFISRRYRENANFPFHNLLWHFFVETQYQLDVSKRIAVNMGDNVCVTGCLPMENVMKADYKPKDVWKPQEKYKKRIIWAPHHTVDYLFEFSNFMTYAESMLVLAKKYQDTIQFAFKPHPVLKFRLINIWGLQKTEEYYHLWETMPNTQLETGDYIDLFRTSDALIHDSGSFMMEYLHVPQNPILYLIRDEVKLYSNLNELSARALDLHYHAYNEVDIERFINNVVIGDHDTMKDEREKFFHDYLYPKDGIMPSKKIVDMIANELNK